MDAPAALDPTAFAASASRATAFLKALANEKRLMILCQLGEGERTVGELVHLVGLEQSALSQHLARLREEGLVATRREAQSIHYRLDSPEVVDVIAVLARHFCR